MNPDSVINTASWLVLTVVSAVLVFAYAVLKLALTGQTILRRKEEVRPDDPRRDA